VKRSFLMVCASVCLIASLAWGQPAKDGVIAINGGKQAVYVKAPTYHGAAEPQDSEKLVTIYSNLGKGDNAYNAISGSGVLGKDAGQPWPQWVASSFIPKSNRVVTKISVGLTHITGPNQYIMSLNEDRDGLPGKRLHKWLFKDVPTFGDCCILQIGKVARGIPVKKGRTYWVVLRTTNDGTDSWGVSNDNILGEQGRWDNNLGSGWINEGIQMLGAFGVFGQ
jgi:hypothetical protein